jgi:hypothetical protein
MITILSKLKNQLYDIIILIFQFWQNVFIQEKPFPPQQELVDRLDISMQWDEFTQDTVKEFIDNLTRMKEIKR